MIKSLEAEELCGYRVSAERKRVWATELDLLKVFIDICSRHELTYFAVSGTLIGAIRHKGFIPWDDDIDLVMPREDYDRFTELASQELKAPYFLQTGFTDDCYRTHAQLRNSSTTGYQKRDAHLNCNKGIFIDIFQLDKIPDSTLLFKLQILKMKLINRVLVNYYYFESEHSKPSLIKRTAHKLIKSYVLKKGTKALYESYEICCKRYKDTDSRQVGQISILFDDKRFRWRRECFEGTIMLPFEDTELCCPVGYDEILRNTYGDYMSYPKNKEEKMLHSEMIFDTEQPFTTNAVTLHKPAYCNKKKDA